VSALTSAGLTDLPARTVETMTVLYGPAVPQRLNAWTALMKQPSESNELAELRLCNRYFNSIPYASDSKHWLMEDFWATPAETVASNGGDCEDYAIAKYFALKERDVPLGKMRITYVRHLKLNEAHMVLAYYPEPDAEPLILDNTINDIKPASQRTDLVPVYSFNDEDVRSDENGGRKVGSPRQLRLWTGLLNRMKKEYNR
jgi:predicted transglutaminase-like cysteine proteinase